MRILQCSPERKRRRDELTALHVDRDLTRALRAEKKLTGYERYESNLRRLASSGPIDEAKEAGGS